MVKLMTTIPEGFPGGCDSSKVEEPDIEAIEAQIVCYHGDLCGKFHSANNVCRQPHIFCDFSIRDLIAWVRYQDEVIKELAGLAAAHDHLPHPEGGNETGPQSETKTTASHPDGPIVYADSEGRQMPWKPGGNSQ